MAGQRKPSVKAEAAASIGWALAPIQTKEYQVAEILREKIFAGVFGRGQKLKQAEIAKMLNISITPVREALKLLEAQGYVRVSAHRGAVVAPFEIEHVDELYQLRLLLEGKLTQAAARRSQPEDIQDLSALNAEMATVAHRKSRELTRAANFRLHFRLYDLAEMPQTLEFVRVLWAKYPFDLIGSIPRRGERVLAEHVDLIEALKAGDARKAARAMQAHIEAGHREFKATYAVERKG